MKISEVEEVHLTTLEGLGSSYRMKGYFTLKQDSGDYLRIEFNGVAFGGTYGGHNVNIELSEASKEDLRKTKGLNNGQIEDILSEVQRRMMNDEMIVEFDKIKPDESGESDGLTL